MINIEPVDNEEIIDWWTRFYASEKSTQKADKEKDFPKITVRPLNSSEFIYNLINPVQLIN